MSARTSGALHTKYKVGDKALVLTQRLDPKLKFPKYQVVQVHRLYQ